MSANRLHDEVRKHNASTYTNHGCRCATCRKAHAEAQRRRRLIRTALLRAGAISVEHGKYSTYTNYGCRCDECRAANAESERRRKIRTAGEAVA